VRFAVRTVFFVSVGVLALAAVSGCKASVEGKVDAGKEGDIADFDKPMDPKALSATRAVEEPGAQTALLGARQDLSYRGSQTPRCKCLAVAVGQPTDASFQWAGVRPSIDRDTEVVVALSSGGISCDGPAATGASYWGYEVVGQDVVVVVESAKPGRPVAQGAIIPRPTGSGQVYVRPVDKDVPYGRPQSGSGDRCQVANLAPVPSASAAPSSWTTIRTKEADPNSTRVDIPEN
jgi:hypothetical protein